MTKILTLPDRMDWTSYVQKAAEFDFYHTWHYHTLEKNDTPVLFIYEEDENFIGLPLLKRKIEGTAYYDLTCVYGFSGPFSNKKIVELDERLMDNFKAEFLNFLSKGNYVSVFVRMHPFFQQHHLLERFGGVYDNGETVYLDLNIGLDQQRKNYRQSAMDSIKHAWKRGFRVDEEKSEAAINLFIDIYSENMHRVGASDYYFFSKEYFFGLFNSTEYDARLLTVYDGEIPISSTIITFTSGIIQAHLVGTRTKYLNHSPTKFLVDEITKMGRRDGMRFYNLGGGLGFKKDNLFYWKSAFSDLSMEYKSWRYIANQTLYDELLKAKGIEKDLEIDFFPLYRYV